jgi:hypothetical protein
MDYAMGQAPGDASAIRFGHAPCGGQNLFFFSFFPIGMGRAF